MEGEDQRLVGPEVSRRAGACRHHRNLGAGGVGDFDGDSDNPWAPAASESLS